MLLRYLVLIASEGRPKKGAFSFSSYKKGFSLLEVIISAILLSLIMLGLTNVFISGKRHLLRAQSQMTVGELGKYFLNPLQMQVRQDTWNTSCLNTSECTIWSGSQNVSGIQYNASYVSSNVSIPNLTRVIVNISWPSY